MPLKLSPTLSVSLNIAASTWSCEPDDTLYDVLHEVRSGVHHNSE